MCYEHFHNLLALEWHAMSRYDIYTYVDLDRLLHIDILFYLCTIIYENNNDVYISGTCTTCWLSNGTPLEGMRYIHRRFIYKGDTRTHAQGTDPRVALGA